MPAAVHVLVVQTEIREAAGSGLEPAIADNLFRAIALVDKAAARSGAPDIVVLPEFFLTGMASTRPHDECLRMARTIDGAEIAVLGELARRHDCYVAGAFWERDDAWPGRFFNAAFVIGPNGTVELHYRKLNEGNFHAGVTGTTPADVLDAYDAGAGNEAMFPVLETPHGVLGCVVCNDINFPETIRQLVARGADIILHPTGEPNGGYLDTWQASRVARAVENRCYWVSANHGAYRPVLSGDAPDRGERPPVVLDAVLPGGLSPANPTLGASQVLGPTGELLGLLGQGEGTLDAWLDVEECRALRRASRVDGWPTVHDVLAAGAEELATAYESAPGFPSNLLLREPLQSAAEGLRILGAVAQSRAGSSILPTTSTEPARVLAFGDDVRLIDPGTSARDVARAVEDAIDATRGPLAAETERVGASIVVLPQGWPVAIAGEHSGFEPDLAVLDPVQSLARELGCYVATAVRVRTESGARREGVVFGPDGALVLRRPVIVPTAIGYEGADTDVAAPLGSIVDTPYGRLGVLVGREIVSVEAVRLQAFAGAELLLHPTFELDAWALDPLRAIARARASENGIWIASAHPARLGGRAPAGASLGATAVHDDRGVCIAEVPAGRAAGGTVTFDAAALRRRRSQGATNKLLQLRSSVYGPAYRSAPTFEKDDVG